MKRIPKKKTKKGRGEERGESLAGVCYLRTKADWLLGNARASVRTHSPEPIRSAGLVGAGKGPISAKASVRGGTTDYWFIAKKTPQDKRGESCLRGENVGVRQKVIVKRGGGYRLAG